MRKISYFILILFLQILFVKVSFATLTVTTTNANCSNNGSITLSSNNGSISSFNYSGISSGSIAGSTINLSAGIYSVTATLSSGNTETLNSIIVDHEDHIQLKNWYLTGNIPSTSVNWGSSLDNPLMTGWTGITINANGCVTDIKLFAKNITGNIPNFNLPKLNYLYLGNNQLNGNIPNFNLIKFNYFNLSNNQLSGTIPNFNFQNLNYLNLSNNQLSGTIPSFKFQSLSHLYLSNNQLSGTVPNFNLPNLQYLNLNNNQLSGTIPNFNLPNLRYLYLNNNQLSGNIPNFNLTNLEILYLNDNQLSGCISTQIKTNCPLITSIGGNISNNSNLSTQSWTDYWNNYAGACLEVTYTSTVANCGANATITLKPNYNVIASYTYTGTTTGNGTGNTLSIPTGIYSITVTANNGQIATISDVIAGNNDHIQLKNWYLSGNIPSTSVNWGATLDDPLMTGWTGITKNGNNCITDINLSNKNITGAMPNFNLPMLTNLLLQNNQLSGCIPYEIKLNCPLITSSGGNISNNPSLSIQSWVDYWNNNSGACLNLSYNSTIANCGNNSTITLALNYGTIASYSYSGYSYNGAMIGNGTGNIFNVPTGIYSVTVTANSGQTATLNNVIAENNDHIQLKNWYLTGNIPSTSVNWGATLDNPLMQGWTGISTNTNGCVTVIDLFYKSISGPIPNFNLPNLGNLNLGYNQLSGTIPNFNLPNLTSLYLSNNQLSGTIPNFNLPNLGSLSLGNNQLSGTIPNFNLPNLKYLTLDYNLLSGTIPNFNLPKLTDLYLNNNQLSGTIPSFNLPKLYSLYLNNNQLSGCIPIQIKTNCPLIVASKSNISNNPNLSTQSWADYWNNYIGACFEVTYTSTVANCGNSATITLKPSYNSIAFCTFTGTISGNGPGNTFSVPTGIYSITVTANNGQVDTLNDVIAENTDHFQLKNWYLTGNIPSASVNWGATLNDPFMTNWTGITKNTNGCITAINLSNKNITGAIPNFNLPYLTNLQLQDNQLSGCIPYEIKLNCPLITSSGGNISNNTNLSTPSWSDYWNNDSGACLNLSYNSTIANCGNNSTISLVLNYGTIASYSYSGTTTGSGTGNSFNVPTGIYSVTVTANSGQTASLNNIIFDNEDHIQLKNWYLTGNVPASSVNWGATLDNPLMTGWTGITTNTNGCIIGIILSYKSISSSIPNFNLPNLQYVVLSGNQLSGTIPNFNLPNLYSLDLSNNQLTGSIPNFNLPNLGSLILRNNQLTGSIPNFNLPNLTYLELSKNQLSGTIPNFNLLNLNFLFLDRNQLSGIIPNFDLPNLQQLILLGNQLSSTIPNFNLPNLTYLHLNNNQLSGTIPNFNLKKLKELSLGSNQLSGSIPNFNLPKLQFLSLNDNQLSGCIPLQLKYNCPLIGQYLGYISNNPNLSTQVWADYWNSSIGACPASVLNAKVLLQNATNGLISSYLSSLNTFPHNDPYASSPLNANFTHVNNPTVAQIAPIALTITGNDTIVDWVFLELRTGTSGSSTVAYTKTALLQADGDIVGMNGSSPVVFENAMPGNYFVAVRHRNHLSFRTTNKLALSTSPTPFDFTNNSIPLYGAFPTVAIGQNQFAMCSGDANSDGSIDAFDTIGWEIQNGLFDDYNLNSDYNMDGSVDAFDSIIWELNNGKFQELD